MNGYMDGCDQNCATVLSTGPGQH